MKLQFTFIHFFFLHIWNIQIPSLYTSARKGSIYKSHVRKATKCLLTCWLLKTLHQVLPWEISLNSQSLSHMMLHICQRSSYSSSNSSSRLFLGCLPGKDLDQSLKISPPVSLKVSLLPHQQDSIWDFLLSVLCEIPEKSSTTSVEHQPMWA